MAETRKTRSSAAAAATAATAEPWVAAQGESSAPTKR